MPTHLLIITEAAGQLPQGFVETLQALGFHVTSNELGPSLVARTADRHIDAVVMCHTAKPATVSKLLGAIPALAGVPVIELRMPDDITSPIGVGADINAALQRAGSTVPLDEAEAGGITVSTSRHVATVLGRQIPLNPKQFQVLDFLIRRPDRAFTRRQLINALWPDICPTQSRTIDVAVMRLRRTLALAGAPDVIKTVRGHGYMCDSLARSAQEKPIFRSGKLKLLAFPRAAKKDKTMNKYVAFARSIAVGVAGLVITSWMIAETDHARAAEEVNVYSYRQPFLIRPLFKSFTKQTGIKVNVVFAKKGLIERIAAEGRNSPADILLTVDIGRLSSAVRKGVSQAVSSNILNGNIPATYRDPAGHWFGLTRRARVVYASRDRVKQTSITYEELADPRWKGKICVRSGQHVYNVALIASILAHHGTKKAEKWLRGVKANLAHKPAGNDRAQVKGVYAGECDIAIANTYYMAKMMLNAKKPEEKKWAGSVRILFPNTNKRGTHVNLSGVVMARHAPHRNNALKLMEFLSGDEAQRIYAEVNHEYPVKTGVAWSGIVKSWGPFKADPLSLDAIAQHRKPASELVDRVLFNDGPTS